MQMKIDDLLQREESSQGKFDLLKQKLEQTETDLERTKPFEQEVKEKMLLIGKLRHEGEYARQIYYYELAILIYI